MGSLRSLYAYGGALAVTVHRFKYGKRLDLARPLAALLAPGLADPEALLVPIPSSQRALRHRGFDPLREILRTLDCFPRPDLCRSLNAQVMRSATLVAAPWPRYGDHHRWAPLLVRVDNGKPQASRPAHERRALSPEVFHLRRRPSPEDRPILLVDDVLATGATVRAAMAVFRAAGIRDVRAVTLLRSEVRTPT